MINFHDPFRQENNLQQCLSHDKKPIAFFFGAGTPMAIQDPSCGTCLIPDISELTRKICTSLSLDPNFRDPFKNIIDFFIDCGINSPNIEQILSHIRDLKKIVGKGKINGLDRSILDHLDNEICKTINTVVNKCLPDSNTPYHRIAAWVNAISRTEPIEFFTTNYDLLMEQALEDFHIPYFDGFSGSRYTFFDIASIEDDKLPSRWARLWKLHGSVNWFENSNNIIYRSYKPYSDDDVKIIHPSNMKYDESRKLPYLAMIDRLSKFIRKPSALLLICGYSFRDEHINDVIIQGLMSNPSSIVFGMVFGAISSYPEAVKLAKRCPNFSLLAEDQGVIGTQQLPWLEKELAEGPFEDSVAITWIDNPTKDKKLSRFHLGNFKNVGDFFVNIIGL